MEVEYELRSGGYKLFAQSVRELFLELEKSGVPIERPLRVVKRTTSGESVMEEDV